jgi:hypothetical protein
MELVVDLSTAAVELRAREDMDRFSVLVVPEEPGDGADRGALGALAAALSVHDAGTVEPGGDVLVPVTAVKRLAGEAATGEGQLLGSDWESGFDTMLDYASTKGWLADGTLRAHVEWGS